MRPSRLKQIRASGKAATNCRRMLPGAIAAEQLAGLGWASLTVDQQHDFVVAVRDDGLLAPGAAMPAFRLSVRALGATKAGNISDRYSTLRAMKATQQYS